MMLLWLPSNYGKNEMANKYSWEYHALCFSENRKGIFQIYPKIEDFVQFMIFLLN